MHTIETLLTRATGRLESLAIAIMDEVQSQSLAVELQTSQRKHRYLLRETGVSSDVDRWPDHLTRYEMNESDQLFLVGVTQKRFSGGDEGLVVLTASSKHQHLLIQGEWSNDFLIHVATGIEDGEAEDTRYRCLFTLHPAAEPAHERLRSRNAHGQIAHFEHTVIFTFPV
jgi:hypothetical protein